MKYSIVSLCFLCVFVCSGCGITVTLPTHTSLIVSSQIGTYAIDINTGKQIWQSRWGAFNTPAVQGDQILVAYTNYEWGTVALLDPATGAPTWTKKLLAGVSMSAPVLDHGIVYITAVDGQTTTAFAIKLKGDVIWQHAYPHTSFGNVTLQNGHLILLLSDAQYEPLQYLQLDTLTGAVQHTLIFGPITSPNASLPVITDSGVYLGANNGTVTALDSFTAGKRWTTQLPGKRDEISSLDIDGTTLYVATGHTVFALNIANGHIIWHTTVPGSADRSHQLYQPRVLDRTLYLYAPNDTIVYALDPHNGSMRWHFDKVGYASAPPLVAEGVAYFPGFTNVSLVQASDGTPIKQLGTNLSNASYPALITMPTTAR